MDDADLLAIARILTANPATAFALIIEPGALADLITNVDFTPCRGPSSNYTEQVAYALASLNLPNVVIYLDAANGGWFGWRDNLRPAADWLARVFRVAGSPGQVRGIAVNVAGWNSW